MSKVWNLGFFYFIFTNVVKLLATRLTRISKTRCVTQCCTVHQLHPKVCAPSCRCTGTCGALRSPSPTWLTGFTAQSGGCTSVPSRTFSGWDMETASPACSCQVQFAHDVTPRIAQSIWSSPPGQVFTAASVDFWVHRCRRAELRRLGRQSLPQRQAEAGVGGEGPAGQNPAGAHQPGPHPAGRDGPSNLPAEAPGKGGSPGECLQGSSQRCSG